MIKFNVSIVLTDEQIQGLYQLFLYRNERLTKKDFLNYMKEQVKLCGADEFLLSSDENLEELTMSDVEQLMKWGLI